MDLSEIPDEDQRKLKSLATRIMSNGVEVLVKDKNSVGKHEQRNVKFHPSSSPHRLAPSPSSKSLLASAVSTIVNRQQARIYPVHQLMQHNYIIKTCVTTFTYLTTVVQNKRSAISTFETIVSVVTTETLTNLYATDLFADIKPTKTRIMEVKTIHPSVTTNIFKSSVHKVDKRIDDYLKDHDDHSNFDIIQPSEVNHSPCTSSCSCEHTKTEGLKTHYHMHNKKVAIKTSNLDVRPTGIDKKSSHTPYDFEIYSQLAPTDKIVEKYTEVMNDYTDEKDNPVDESELLTNEQALPPSKKEKNPKNPEKTKPNKAQKLSTQKPQTNKNKFVVADLLKLGSLGIKGLSQLAPVFEKMTGGFIKRKESNKTTTTTTTSTLKPIDKISAYSADKRIDSDIESKHNNFPIYIPVDELDTSESQTIFTNATLHQNLPWNTDHKQAKSHIGTPKIVHESPLVNGGIPISPGEIITANSDVIVGKPAVGGPLTLAASGIRLQNPVNPPPIDSFISASEQYVFKEKPPVNEQEQVKVDDSYDLRPPEMPKPKPNRIVQRPPKQHEQFNYLPHLHQHSLNKFPYRPHMPSTSDMMKTESLKNTAPGNHGRPAYLEFIPSQAKPDLKMSSQKLNNGPPTDDLEVSDNSASSSEIHDLRVKTNGDMITENQRSPNSINRPFLVDIQPSKVANVLIPHGSSTALVFAGSSEPLKTGQYVDDPLPYQQPGYFGTFSIDAPQMTNVHNNPPSSSKPPYAKMNTNNSELKLTMKENHSGNDEKQKWNDNKRPINSNRLPPPMSKQETHLHIGPQITVYNPDIYKPTSSGKFEKYNQKFYKDPKEVIDKEYENYLAVPPPPPPKTAYKQEIKNFNHKPVVHNKPVQDTKVFLNIQHPIPQPHYASNENVPSKVTSEIYFAAQAPQNMPKPTYTVHIPHQNSYRKPYNQATPRPIQSLTSAGVFHANPHQTMQEIKPPSVNSGLGNDLRDQDTTYSVTLNTATNVANNLEESMSGIGSSIPVSIDSSNMINTEIPVRTNFAIKVEGGHSQIENNYNSLLQGNINSTISYDEQETSSSQSSDDQDNNSSNEPKYSVVEANTVATYNENSKSEVTAKSPSISSINSHANFPMINEHSSLSEEVKPVTEIVDDVIPEQKRPAKLIPNIPTNSHGWYSSVPIKDLDGITSIDIEASTRKPIPLLSEYNNDYLPDFGQKVSTVGKPPSEFWTQNTQDEPDKALNRPLQTLRPYHSTSKPVKSNYIPNHIGSNSQPVYDIPIRDNSDETTTAKSQSNSHNFKQVYENAHEIYDGEEGEDVENDGEISSESIKIPVVSVSSENKDENYEKLMPPTELSLLEDEVVGYFNNKNHKDNTIQLVNFNPGTQTEKPFDVETYNKSKPFQSNAMKPIYDSNYNMRPRPFTVSTGSIDHQLHQPHWQINELLENATNVSYEDSIELNIGEEINTDSTSKPKMTQKVEYRPNGEKYKRPARPILSVRPQNETIITSTVNIKDKKPITIFEDMRVKSSTTPTVPITSSKFNASKSSSDIINLSPPPPTLDYNFKPSKADETIMGMSPPPPVNSVKPPLRSPLPTRPPVTPRPRPQTTPINRTPPPFRNKPQRTYPPRTPLQRPTRKPVGRDDVSTYRPSYDILNNIKNPSFDYEQPSIPLTLPSKQESSKISNSDNYKPSPIIPVQNVVFPTPTSSGWLTSSSVDFPQVFEFAPTSVHFPEKTKPSSVNEYSMLSSTEKINVETNVSYVLTTEKLNDLIEEQTNSEEVSVSLSSSTENNKTSQDSTEANSDSVSTENNVENTESHKIKPNPIRNYNRTRKPYPVRQDDKKSVSRFQPPVKPSAVIRPTKTLSRSEILYPTRQVSTRKIIKPSSRTPLVRPSIIESSESSIDGNLPELSKAKNASLPTSLLPEKSLASERTPQLESSVIASEILPVVRPTHHAGNEIKIVDEVIPTKTEFKTTVVTLTKTLSEPPKTVSSIGYVNLTHTLTVTHYMTSLISQSEGAVTQTLVMTNTETSTIVDFVTETRTQVQPTTIVETVTKHIPIPQIEPTPVKEVPTKTKIALDDLTMSLEENDNLIIKYPDTTENIQKLDKNKENDTDTFLIVLNKSQNGGSSPSITTDIETSDYDGVTRNEQVNSNGVSQVLFGEILLAGTPYLETNVINNGAGFGKECQPDCKASRNERCQKIDGIMKCVCRPGFARMFPDRPCKPTYTYSVNLALSAQRKEHLRFHESLSDNSSSQYRSLALAAHEGINRMIMQSDLRDVYHGVHITGFHPVEMRQEDGEGYQGVMNEFYVQLSDNAHESRLKEVIEKYLRNNNYSLGGTEVYAASELMDSINVTDFDECLNGQFHDCSEHARCFNLRGTYTCSCREGFADLSVTQLYPGRICSAEPVGCERCNYHGACYTRDDARVLCECFQWYSGSACQVNLKVVLISLVTLGAALTLLLAACAAVACSKRPRPPQTSIVACIQGMPGLHQGVQPKQRADRRALINERADSGDASSLQNASLPYIPAKKPCSSKKCVGPPPAHDAPPPPAPAVMIPRARLHGHRDSKEMASRKVSMELSSEDKLISYLESGASNNNEEMMRRKHSMESSYSGMKDRYNKQGALVSAGFKVSTTIRADEPARYERDDVSSVNKNETESEMHFDSLRKSYSQEELSEWTDAERRIGELTLSEARSVGGTLPASTGRAASSTRLTLQTSDVSEFDSL